MRDQLKTRHSTAAGIASGVAGAFAMIAMRKFDEKYAPKTVVKMQPAKPVNELAAQIAYGAMLGMLYSRWRGDDAKGSSLFDGVLLGGVVYAASSLGLLPPKRSLAPITRQKFPQVAGELLRHIAFGVATSGSFEIIEDLTHSAYEPAEIRRDIVSHRSI